MNFVRTPFPRLLLLLITGLYTGLNMLGLWQVQRHHEKQGIIQRITRNQSEPIVELDYALSSVSALAAIQDNDPEEYSQLRLNHFYRRVRLTGKFVHEHEMHMYPRHISLRRGQNVVAFDVVTPFKLENGTVVLVNRGRAPVTMPDGIASDTRLQRSQEMLTLTATITPLPRKSMLTPDNNLPRNQWFHIDFKQVVSHTKLLNLMPVYVLQEPYTPMGERIQQPHDAFPRVIGFVLNIRDNHVIYALTWYILSFVLLLSSILYYRSWYLRASEKPYSL